MASIRPCPTETPLPLSQLSSPSRLLPTSNQRPLNIHIPHSFCHLQPGAMIAYCVSLIVLGTMPVLGRQVKVIQTSLLLCAPPALLRCVWPAKEIPVSVRNATALHTFTLPCIPYIPTAEPNISSFGVDSRNAQVYSFSTYEYYCTAGLTFLRYEFLE